MIVWRVFYLSREFRTVSPRRTRRKVWKVIEATIQSTAIYTAAGVSLVITFANSTSIGYPTCLNLFPALIVRLRCSEHTCSTDLRAAIQGLVFSFIAIRVALNADRDGRPESQAPGATSSATARATFGSTAPLHGHHRAQSSTLVARLDADELDDKEKGELCALALRPREHRRGDSDATAAALDDMGVLEIGKIAEEKEGSSSMQSPGASSESLALPRFERDEKVGEAV